MKPTKGNLGRYVDQPDPAIRFYLFMGSDQGQSRALAERLLKGLGAEKFAIASGTLKADPALLADEAAAIGLFGGKRLLWIEPAGEEIGAAVEALLAAPAAENSVVAVAGDLKKSSALRKLAEAAPDALGHVSYVPEGDAAERMIEELGRAEGLTMRGGVAARVAAACGNDRAVAAQELAKAATYLGVSPAAPGELDHRTLDEIGADVPESGFSRLADLSLSGDLARLADELGAVAPGEAISIVRSLQRRLLTIIPLRARVDAGETAAAVMASAGKSMFWKDVPVVARIVGNWDARGLERVAARLGRLERELMLSKAPETQALGEELTAIARAVRRR